MNFEEATKMAKLSSVAGLGALSSRDKPCIKIARGFGQPLGSIDIDENFRPAEPQANRWDYAVGFEIKSELCVVWVEPHSATSTHEITTMLNKLEWLKCKLRSEPFYGLRKLTDHSGKMNLRRFWWVTAGKVNIRRGTPQEKRLAQAGLNFPVSNFTLGKA